MTLLNRRAFGGGAAASLAALSLPSVSLASAPFRIEDLDKELRWFVDQLIEAYQKFQRADAVYGQGNPLFWGDDYGDLIDAHHELQMELTDDTPVHRALRDWCNRLGQRPCQQALAFWMPIPDLSEKFAELHPNIRKARATYARARYQFWMQYPSAHPLTDNELDAFNACISTYEKAGDAWFAVRGPAMCTLARTPGDRELLRRLVQTYVTEDTIDVPYLKTILPDWKPYLGEHPQFRRCGDECPDCERLLGPRSQFESDTEDEADADA